MCCQPFISTSSFFILLAVLLSFTISVENSDDFSATSSRRNEAKMQCDKDDSECGAINNSDKNNDLYKDSEDNVDKFKGHLEPFGESGSKTPIQEVTGFPDSNSFFMDYVLPSVPVLMKGAATMSPAFHKWTDDYLLRLSGLKENRNVKISVERGKKETRRGDGLAMTFHDFLKAYNHSDIYLVTEVLPFMEPYFTLPCPLQCSEMKDIPMKHLMWFSSGGTKSVVHTDKEENINCLYRGNKTLFMLDPATISTGTILDAIYGVFSKLDVDSVDLNQYPTLRGASFVVATMEPGDCLYIPHHWIHQVQSFGSNLAVNTWFKHDKLFQLCTGLDLVCDPTFALGRVKHPHLSTVGDPLIDGVEVIRNLFHYASIHGEAVVTPDRPPITKGQEKVKVKEFVKLLVENKLDPFTFYYDFEEAEVGLRDEYVKKFCDLLLELDVNSDGVLTAVEFEDGVDEMWESVKKMLEIFVMDDGGSGRDDNRGDNEEDENNDKS